METSLFAGLFTGMTILVVEDDAVLRTLITKQLAGAGASVLVTGAAEDAAALVAGGERIDLVVSDVNLPGKDGIELAHTLRERHPSLPVVLTSGDHRNIERVRYEAACPIEYLPKPFFPTALIDAVWGAVTGVR